LTRPQGSLGQRKGLRLRDHLYYCFGLKVTCSREGREALEISGTLLLLKPKCRCFFKVEPLGPSFKSFETLRFYNYSSEMRGRDLGGMGGPGNRWHSALAEAKVYVFFFSGSGWA